MLATPWQIQSKIYAHTDARTFEIGETLLEEFEEFLALLIRFQNK